MNHQFIWILEVLFLFILDKMIGDEGAKEIAKLLENNKTLTDLDLRGTFLLFILVNNIRVQGAKEIAKSLETNRTLTSLNLESTFFIHLREQHWS